MTPVAQTLGERRRIDTAKLNTLISEKGLTHRGIARAIVGPDASARQAEVKRRHLLKWIDGEGITDASAARLASAIGCDPEDFLLPAPTPGERRLAQIRRQQEALQAEAEALEQALAEERQRQAL